MEKREKLYRVVSDDIIKKIRHGEIKIGDKLPTTKELSEKYGVSVITVERAMRELKEMNIVYSVKKAGTFVNGKKGDMEQKVIACLLPNSLQDCLEIYESVCVAALFNNTFVDFMDSKNDPKKERENLKRVLRGDYAGVIYSPCEAQENVDLVSEMKIAKKPLVFVDCAVDGISAPLVTSDGIQGEKILIDYLVENGHKNIAFYEYSDMVQTERQRYEGYCNGLIEHEIALRRDYMYVRRRNRTFGQWFQSLEPRPTAIVCTNDVRVKNVISLLKSIGLSVPADVSVVGFDYSGNLKTYRDYTTVQQNFRKIGRIAVETLFSGKNLDVSRVITAPVTFQKGKTVKNIND